MAATSASSVTFTSSIVGLMGALDGVSVLEVGLVVQGPQAAELLGDWGAEVIKVELPVYGDQSRSLPVSSDDNRSGYYVACNRGKRSVTLDLRKLAARDVFLRLADKVDVVISNFKPGTMERWGLGYETVARRNPSAIYATGSTFGPVGPDSEQEGNDLSGQAAGGLISTTGVDGGDVTPIGATVADHIGSLNLAAGILAALVARARTGRGQRVDASLLGGLVWAQAGEITTYLMTGRVPGRANHGNPVVPGLYSVFATSDGHVAICGVRGESRKVFFDLMGRPDLLQRYGMGLYWKAEREALYDELAPLFRTRSTAEWCSAFRISDIRHAPVRDYAAIVADPGVWENGYLARSPSGEDVIGSPVRFSDTPARPAWDAPELGQNTEEVLLGAGCSWDEIDRLRRNDAI